MATPANHQDYPAHNTRSHSSLSSSSSSSSDSDSSDDTVVSTAKMAEPIIKPKLFKGSVLEDPQHWLYLYGKFITVTKYDDDQAAACFGHFMDNTAEIWYKGLSNTIKDDFNLLKENFKRYIHKWLRQRTKGTGIFQCFTRTWGVSSWLCYESQTTGCTSRHSRRPSM